MKRHSLARTPGPSPAAPVTVTVTLGTYTHVRPDMQRRAAERLEQILFAR